MPRVSAPVSPSLTPADAKVAISRTIASAASTRLIASAAARALAQAQVEVEQRPLPESPSAPRGGPASTERCDAIS